MHTTLLFEGSEVTDAGAVVGVCGTLSFWGGCPDGTHVNKYSTEVNLQWYQRNRTIFQVEFKTELLL